MKMPKSPHLVWIYPGTLEEILSAATQLEVTRELRDLGWEVTFIDGGHDGTRQVRGVEVFGISRGDVYFLGLVLFHLKVIRHLLQMDPPPNAIMFDEMSALWFLPLRLWRFFSSSFRAIIIMDTRSLHMPSKARESLRGRMRRVYMDWMNILGNRFADGRTAITDRMAQALDIPSKKILGIWPSAVTLQPFVAGRSSREWPRNNQAIKIIYLGFLSPERHLMQLARAVRMANQNGLNILLSFVGDGPQKNELHEYAQESNGEIEVLDPVDHAQVPELLTRYHVGALPFPDELIFQVSSPIKMFEYMASGMVVFATRVANLVDVVGQDPYTVWADSATEAGLLEGLERLSLEKESFPDFGILAADAASQLTWRQSASQLKTALELGLSRA